MSKEVWQKGYQEVKNIIHNDIGVTKEEIREVFKEIAKDEILKILSEKGTFINKVVQEVIRDEMVNAVQGHKYPLITGNTIFYRGNSGHGIDSFKDYVSGVMKEEIIKQMREQFNIRLDIDKID